MAWVMELLLTWDDKRRESRGAEPVSPAAMITICPEQAARNILLRSSLLLDGQAFVEYPYSHNKNSAAVAGSKNLATSKAPVADHRRWKLPAARLAGGSRDVVQIGAAHPHDRDVAHSAGLSGTGPG